MKTGVINNSENQVAVEDIKLVETELQGMLLESERLIAEGDRCCDANQYHEASLVFLEAISIRISVFGEQAEAVAVAINRLANVYYQLKDDLAAGELFERALAIREVALSPDASDLRMRVNNLANAYRNQGRFAEAEPLYMRSLRMREKETGHTVHPAIWRNLVRVFEGQGNATDGEEYVEKLRWLEFNQKKQSAS